MYFSGTIDPMSTRLKGKWGTSSDKRTHTNIFDFQIHKAVEATMTMTSDKKGEVTHRVSINFDKMIIENAGGVEKEIKEFYAIEAVDTAELKYFILQPDVTLIEHEGVWKVQAKLKSIEEEDMNSNGKGVTNTSLILYNISEVKESENKEKKGQFHF